MDNQNQTKIIRLNPSSLLESDLSPDLWVDRYTKLHGISYSYKTHSVREKGEPLEAGVLISQMRLYCYTHSLNEIKRMLPDAYLVWRREQAKKYLRSLKNELSFQPSEVDHIAAWVEGATGQKDPLNIAVARHFVWQVRRKLYGHSVEHHMMMVLFGSSGGGKSVAIQKLVAPLNDVTSFRDLRIFNDAFARRAFNRSYIMYFDEMGRSQDTDVNALKDVITASVVDWRGLGSETIHSAAQNSTFIGTSNLPVRERIKDPTSSRRFWQLNCASRLNWGIINSIDYRALWKSVDENGPCPIAQVLDQVRAVQENEIKYQDLTENWLANFCEPYPFDPHSPNTDALYFSFSEYCRLQMIFDFDGFQSFARGLQQRISNLKWEASSKRSNRGTIWSLRLKQSDDLICQAKYLA